MTSLILGITACVFCVSLALTRWLISGRTPITIADEPNERSLHTQPRTRTGGLAVLVAAALGIAGVVGAGRAGVGGAAAARVAAEFTAGEAWALWVPMLLLAAVSFWDDKRSLSPAVRLGAQAMAAAVVVAARELHVGGFSVPGGGDLTLGWAAYPVSILFVVWMTNLYNFMDGMDGFAGGMTFFGCSFFACIALMNGDATGGLLALIMAASAAGFLAFNFPPSRLFMGDVGSAPLGFLTAVMVLRGQQEHSVGLWLSLVIFSPFIVDATAVLIRRLLGGKRIWQAHREHYYQRLVLAGWSQRRTVLAEYVLMITCGIVAVVHEASGRPKLEILLAACLATYVGLAWSVGAVERRSAGAARRPET